MVSLLLANKADVNARDNDGATPLQWAQAFETRKDVADLLMAHNAQYSVYDVAAFGYVDKLQALLKGNPELVFSKDYGRTPLFFAAKNGQRDAVALLLASNAEVDLKDDEGEHLCTCRGEGQQGRSGTAAGPQG